MKLRLYACGVAFALSIGTVRSALADTVIYSQPFANPGTSYTSVEPGGQKLADNFTLTTSGTANQVSFVGIMPYGIPSTNNLKFFVNFFTDNGGVPGTQVSSQLVTPTWSYTGTYDTYAEALYTAALSPVTLTALQPYWVSIAFDNNSNGYVFGWTVASSGENGYAIADDSDPWQKGSDTSINNFNFTLSNTSTVTPEPSAISLLSIGLLGVCGVARKRYRPE